MVKLEEFRNLNKKENDLLNKNYCSNTFAGLKACLKQDDIMFVTKAYQLKSSNLLLSALLEYKKNNLLVKINKKSDGLAYFLLEYSPIQIPNLLASLEYKLINKGTQKKSTPGLIINYFNEKAKFRAVLQDNPLIINFSLTAGMPEYGLGLDWKFALTSQKYTEYSIATWWFKKNSRLIAKYTGTELSNSTLELSYYLKINPSLRAASLVTTNWANKATSIRIGADYKFDEITKFKGNIDSNGKIQISMQRKLTDQLDIILGSRLDTKEITSNAINEYSFGFIINFNK
jgi:Eukaryotic porin